MVLGEGVLKNNKVMWLGRCVFVCFRILVDQKRSLLDKEQTCQTNVSSISSFDFVAFSRYNCGISFSYGRHKIKGHDHTNLTEMNLCKWIELAVK